MSACQSAAIQGMRDALSTMAHALPTMPDVIVSLIHEYWPWNAQCAQCIDKYVYWHQCDLSGCCLFCGIRMINVLPIFKRLHARHCPYFISILCSNFSLCSDNSSGTHRRGCVSAGQPFGPRQDGCITTRHDVALKDE